MESSLHTNKYLDWKSLVIGLLIGILVLMASGHQTGNAFNGRFWPVAGGTSNEVLFIVDTFNGQTWRMDATTTIDYGIPELRGVPEAENPEN